MGYLAFAFGLLAVVAANAEAEADAYTMGQVAHGFTNGGVITGVDYGNGHLSGVGAIGNRAIHSMVAPAVTYSAHHAIATPAVHSGYMGVHSGIYAPSTYGGHYYGKREAYTLGQVAHGFTNGGVITGVDYGHGHLSGVGAIGNRAVHSSIYAPSTYGGHFYGKREAEAEADAYTIGQVAHGFTNGGVITGVDYGNGHLSGVGAIGNRAVLSMVAPAVTYSAHHAIATPAVHSGYSGVHSGIYAPSTYGGHYYGKREAEAEAEADAYTLGQVAHGLTNGGVITGVHGVASTYAHGVHGVVAPAMAVPAVHTIATPAVAYSAHHAVAAPAVYSGVRSGIHAGVYSGVNAYNGYNGYSGYGYPLHG